MDKIVKVKVVADRKTVRRKLNKLKKLNEETEKFLIKILEKASKLC